MGKCEGCVFWEGDESSYRAKCSKMSDDRQTITTAFDESCPAWLSRAPKPQLIVPDMQSMTRGIYFGGNNGNFVPQEIAEQVFRKVVDRMRDQIDQEILFGRPVSEVQGLLPDVSHKVTFGDWSKYIQPIEVRDFSVDVTYERPYPGVSPLLSYSKYGHTFPTISGEAKVDPTQLLGINLMDAIDLVFTRPNGTEISTRATINRITMNEDGLFEIGFDSDNMAMRNQISTLPLDDEFEDDEEDGEWDEEWDVEEEADEDFEEDPDDLDEDDDEGYNGNRRYWL